MLGLLRKFYREETREASSFHKALTYSYYFVFGAVSFAVSRNVAKSLFRNYLKVGFIPMRITLKDGIVINHHLEDYTVFFEMLLYDEYDFKNLPPGSVVVDVDANIGLVSVLAEKRRGAKKVVSFEPCSDNFAFLKKNVEENSCKNIVLNKAAVADKTGTVKLFLHSSGTHSISGMKPGKHYETVDLTTLDASLAGVDGIDLLKIDVEDAELSVLQGAKETLKRTQRIAMEWTSMCSHEEILKILEDSGFDADVRKNIVFAVKHS